MSQLDLPEVINIKNLPKLVKDNAWLQQQVTEVDFSAVKSADSATLAMLLHWAKNAQQPIQVINFPAQLKPLVELYDLDAVIEFK